MAVLKTISLPGGFEAPAYLAIGSYQIDRFTNALKVIIRSWPSREARDAYMAAMANVKTADARANTPPAEGKLPPLSNMRIREDAAAKLAATSEGTHYREVMLSEKEAAPAIVDGVVDIAALYELLKQPNMALEGGVDC